MTGILNLSNQHIERNFTGIREKLLSIDCTERDVGRLILDYLQVIFLSSRNFNDKMVCLIQPEIYIKHITINSYILCTSTAGSMNWKSLIITEIYRNGNLTLIKRRIEAKLKS